MTRIVLTVASIIMLNILVVGCTEPDSGRGQLVITDTGRPRSLPVVKPAEGTETDLIEKLAADREAYRQGLVALTDYYGRTGNNLKLQWARTELAALEQMPRYNYVIEAALAGPDLKASAAIPQADELYAEAADLHKEGERLILIKDSDLLRLALDKYNQLIRKYPTSDKIDDAAYKAGTIFEHFKDYSIAFLYYQRAFQWDPATPYPARFKAAYIQDVQMHNRAKALELYLQAVQTEGKDSRNGIWKTYAERRIEELSKSGSAAQ
jgi:tetratricopeptide (TPR) repeat protein